MEACPQISYDLVFQSKQGPIFSYHISKIPKVLQKKDYDFSNGQIPKTYIFGSFFETNRSVAAHPKKKFVNIFADSEPCIKYRDFGT